MKKTSKSPKTRKAKGRKQLTVRLTGHALRRLEGLMLYRRGAPHYVVTELIESAHTDLVLALHAEQAAGAEKARRIEGVRASDVDQVDSGAYRNLTDAARTKLLARLELLNETEAAATLREAIAKHLAARD